MTAAGCTIGSGGICAAGAPAIIGASAGLGGSIGGLIGTAAEGAPDIVSAFGEGLSWWDKARLKIKIIIGAVLTEGELQQRLEEQERLRQQQQEEIRQKKKEQERGSGDPPPDPDVL